MTITAVLWDFGGVFTRSPFAAVNTFATARGIEEGLAFELIFGPYDSDTDHPWHRLERGAITMIAARTEIVALAAAQGIDLDPFEALRSMGSEDDERDAVVARALEIRAAGYRTALITNNIAEFGDGWRRMVPVDDLFDTVVDSCQVGVRKPDPRIFQLALDALDVSPAQAVMVDDAPGNIAGARALGMHTVLVGPDRRAALSKLDALLG
jgi:putative hydrolase of the HAD superfamily